jgi:hypothetical protein
VRQVYSLVIEPSSSAGASFSDEPDSSIVGEPIGTSPFVVVARRKAGLVDNSETKARVPYSSSVTLRYPSNRRRTPSQYTPSLWRCGYPNTEDRDGDTMQCLILIYSGHGRLTTKSPASTACISGSLESSGEARFGGTVMFGFREGCTSRSRSRLPTCTPRLNRSIDAGRLGMPLEKRKEQSVPQVIVFVSDEGKAWTLWERYAS